MRVVEKNIIKAIKEKKTLNLSKRDFTRREDGKTIYTLWNSDVFILYDDGKIEFSFCGWTSNTTKSRINSLLWEFSNRDYISQKNYVLYFNHGEKIDPCKKYTIIDGILS